MFNFLARLNSANTSPSAVPMSPTKSGIMREDKHWVLMTPRCDGFDHPYAPHKVCHALTSNEVQFDMWRQSPEVAKLWDNLALQDRWIGRRVNDEVELFFEEGDEEVRTE